LKTRSRRERDGVVLKNKKEKKGEGEKEKKEGEKIVTEELHSLDGLVKMKERTNRNDFRLVGGLHRSVHGRDDLIRDN
jgi:hypothetical protein